MKTYYATNAETLKQRLKEEEMKLPVVIRPKVGSEIVINNAESINTIIDAFEKLEQPMIIQELEDMKKVNILSIGTSFFAEHDEEKYELLNEQKNIVYKIKQLLNVETLEITAYINNNSLVISDEEVYNRKVKEIDERNNNFFGKSFSQVLKYRIFGYNMPDNDVIASSDSIEVSYFINALYMNKELLNNVRIIVFEVRNSTKTVYFPGLR